TFGNGATSTYNYHPDRRWVDGIQTTLKGTQVQTSEYTHYNNGLVHTINSANSDPREYLYDNLNRLSFDVVTPSLGAQVSTPYSYAQASPQRSA
ncbi:MAG TPA: hypothetical protein VHW01_25390, partial [Polyangiaceae bacterium]|nr:hypothetical protein [Polyangiaceae bacterium]